MKELLLQTSVAMLLLQDDGWSVLGAAGAQGVSCGGLCYLPSSLRAATVSETLFPVLWACSQSSSESVLHNEVGWELVFSPPYIDGFRGKPCFFFLEHHPLLLMSVLAASGPRRSGSPGSYDTWITAGAHNFFSIPLKLFN